MRVGIEFGLWSSGCAAVTLSFISLTSSLPAAHQPSSFLFAHPPHPFDSFGPFGPFRIAPCDPCCHVLRKPFAHDQLRVRLFAARPRSWLSGPQVLIDRGREALRAFAHISSSLLSLQSMSHKQWSKIQSLLLDKFIISIWPHKSVLQSVLRVYW